MKLAPDLIDVVESIRRAVGLPSDNGVDIGHWLWRRWLVVRSLSIPEIHGSNLVMSNLYLMSTCGQNERK